MSWFRGHAQRGALSSRVQALVGMVVAINIFVLSVAGWSLLHSRRLYHERAGATTRNLTLALERELEGTIRQIDTTLLWTRAELEGRKLAVAFGNPELDALLAQHLARVPFLNGLQVVNAEGVFVAGLDVDPSRRISIADREYFHEFRDFGPERFVVSKPLLSRLTGEWAVIMGRRLERPGGGFAGALVANVNLTRFTRTLAALNVDAHGTVVLRGEQLASIARFPSLPGESFNTVGMAASPELRAEVALGRTDGTYVSIRNNQHIPRMTSFRKLPGYPFTVVVGLGTEDYLGEWRKQAVQAAVLAAAFLALTILSSWLLLDAWERDRKIQARLITARERRRNQKAMFDLEAQFQQAQKMESLGVLAGGVAHDMNNVLGAILALASSSLESQPEGSPLHHALDTISRAAIRGGTMVRGLLSFARQTPGEIKELDLNTVIREEVELLARTALAQVNLRMELEDGLRLIQGDASALSHALMNLCVNAVDAMGRAGTLTLRTRNAPGPWVELQVEDTGHGMARDVLAKALDPFYTTKPQGKGTGLGLSMVYSTVKAHQGEMELKSEVGRGTCVCMRFPAVEPAAPEPDPAGEVQAPDEARHLTILVVDDDEFIQMSTEVLLDLMGHVPTIVASGEEALRKLEEGYLPDVVILDMNMPGLGGEGTLPALRLMCPDLPVILATGRADQSALDLVASQPQVTLLPKPFTMEALRLQFQAL